MPKHFNHMNGHTSKPYEANGIVRNTGVTPPIVNADMCVYCFDVLHHHLHNLNPPIAPPLIGDQYPIFITWNIDKDKKLRGCQGTFTSLNLVVGLREYSLKSALHDSRFPPIAKAEMNRLTLSVSILRDFERAEGVKDWRVGLHGLKIEFLDGNGQRLSATYLPEVASKRGWSKEQTIESLARKAGLKGPLTPDMKKAMTVTRYQSEKLSMSHAEYLHYCKTHRC